MRQVIMVSLGNNAYNVDDEGYGALRRYLDRARARLKDNPDAEEILGDLERGIGEKCAATLNPNKNVVSAEDIARILSEIGPVDDAPTEDTPPADTPPKDEYRERNPPKALRRKRQGKTIAGVCSGLAEYFAVDVIIVRLAFVGLSLFSGVGLILYVIMALVVPADEAFGPIPAFPKNSLVTVVLLGIAALALFYTGGIVLHGPGFFFGGMGLFEMLVALFFIVAFFGAVALVVGFVAVSLIRHVTR